MSHSRDVETEAQGETGKVTPLTRNRARPTSPRPVSFTGDCHPQVHGDHCARTAAGHRDSGRLAPGLCAHGKYLWKRACGFYFGSKPVSLPAWGVAQATCAPHPSPSNGL